MALKKLKRHWYIVHRPGETDILYLLSAFSPGHIRRSGVLQDNPYMIALARRWHISRVFSALPVFVEPHGYYVSCDTETQVPNEFHMKDEDLYTFVMVVG